MAAKKRGKKVSRKKKVSKPKKEAPVRIRATRRKINLVVKNLIVFVLLSVISYILFLISNKDPYITFFGFAYVILGLISVALFIVFLVLIIMKLMKK